MPQSSAQPVVSECELSHNIEQVGPRGIAEIRPPALPAARPAGPADSAWASGSWASAATPVEHLLAVGVGLEDVFGQNFDLIGLGLSWGRPRDGPRRDQYALETFYRFHLTEHTHLTPDIQLIVNPSNAPDWSTVWIFGIRLRTLF